MKKEPKDLAILRKEAEKRLQQQTERIQGISLRDVKSLAHDLGTYQSPETISK